MNSTARTRIRRSVWLVGLIALVLGLLAPSAMTTANAAAGGIAGRVLTSDGTPVSGVTVGALERVSDANGIRYQPVAGGTTTTATDGSYNIPTAAGRFRVVAEATSVYTARYHPDAAYLDQATDVVVGDTVALERNITLRRPGTVTGSVVRALGGTPVAGATATLERSIATDTWVEAGASAFTTPNGTFEIQKVRPGSNYRVRLSSPGFATQTTTVAGSVSEGQASSSAQVTLFNDDEGVIQGKVTNFLDQPVINVQVRARQRIVTPEGTTLAVVADPVATGPDGRYAISLPKGRYRLEFSGPQLETEYYYDFDDESSIFGDEVTVNASQFTNNIDVQVRTISPGFNIENLTPPAVLGNVGYGRTLTASPGTWTAASGTTFRYQWIRCTAIDGVPDTASCDGEPIANATSSTYTIPNSGSAADLTGARYRVEVYPEFDRDYSVISDATSPSPGPSGLHPLVPHPQTGFENRARPVIQGTPRVGLPLTASTGTWSTTPTSVTLQWFANGAVIPGATSATYVVADSYRGTSLTVRATATLGGTTATSGSFPSDIVTRRTITHLAAPRITGEARVGSVLSVEPGSWSETGLTYSYLWFANELAIPGATNATFTPTATQVGKRISALVQVSKADFDPAAAVTARTLPVVQPGAGPDGQVLTNNSLPTISGTLAVGSTLTAAPGTWTPTPDSFTYVWKANGTTIPGATGPTLPLSAPAYEGTKISVVVTAVKATYGNQSATSAETAAIAKGTLTNTVAPTITGTPAIGQKLTATTGTWSSTPASYTYQWKVDGGTPIPGATAQTYTVPAEANGRLLSVTVTAAKTGFNSGTATSAPVGPITQGQLTVNGNPRIFGSAFFGRTLQATFPTPSPSAGVTRSIQWLRNGLPIAGATGTTYRLVAADLGKRVAVRATYTGTGFTPVARTSGQTAVVKSLPTLKITAKGGATKVFTVRVTAPGTQPTGIVQLRGKGIVLNQKRLARGVVAITLPRGASVKTISVVYLGDSKVAPVTRAGVKVPR